jgi:hypothetical protein
MRTVYAICLGAGWAYVGHRMHWPLSIVFTASVMSVVFGFYLSRVIEDDR